MVRRQPADLRLPRQLDQARRIGHGEQIRVRRRHVEPGGEAREAGAVARHAVDGGGGDELRPHHPEEVGEGDQEIGDPAFLRDRR
jgi:hypothetical protein